MTIKVYKPDGKIEEFPNAYISWEWDEDEKGTDSGFRIHSMDKMMHSVNAFVYPGECERIEITSEESDRIFKPAPSEGGVSGKRFRIFLEINKELKRQDEKWGEQNHPMRGLSDDNIIKRGTILYPEDSTLKHTLSTFRYRNETKKAGWFDILQEEVCEAFLEVEPEKQREEMLQVNAVTVQIIECLDRRIEEAKRGKGD